MGNLKYLSHLQQSCTYVPSQLPNWKFHFVSCSVGHIGCMLHWALNQDFLSEFTELLSPLVTLELVAADITKCHCEHDKLLVITIFPAKSTDSTQHEVTRHTSALLRGCVRHRPHSGHICTGLKLAVNSTTEQIDCSPLLSSSHRLSPHNCCCRWPWAPIRGGQCCCHCHGCYTGCSRRLRFDSPTV